jgi:CHAD domain-containing protein
MESVERAVETAAPGAGRLVTLRTRELFRVYPRALVGKVEAVHDLRVAARRLRVALTLLAGKPNGRRARRAQRTLRALAAAAGRGRDLDVGIAILEAQPAAVGVGHDRLKRALRASRARARVLSREALLDLDVARLRRDLRECAAHTGVDRDVVLGRLAALQQSEETTIAQELSTNQRRSDADALHGARRSARRLRYAAEIADLLQGTHSGAPDTWRLMQNRLGEIQDRHVLAAWLESRRKRATAAGDAVLATAAARALASVRRDNARRIRDFLAAEASARP